MKAAYAYTNPADKTSMNGQLGDRLGELLKEEDVIEAPEPVDLQDDVDAILSKPFYGSVEGDFSGLMFEATSPKQLPYFWLHSELGVIRCDYAPEKYDELSIHVPRDRESLPRLRVFGLISKTGRKINRIEVKALDWLTPPGYIPGFADIAKLNLLGGRDSLEHVRRARDGE